MIGFKTKNRSNIKTIYKSTNYFCKKQSIQCKKEDISKMRYPLFIMSGKRDSNPRPSAWEAEALPTELLPHYPFGSTNILVIFLKCKLENDILSDISFYNTEAIPLVV